MEKMHVIVIGAVHHNTLGVIRSLGEAGIMGKDLHVLLISKESNSPNIITASKYVDQRFTDYVDSNNEIVSWLLEHAHCKDQEVIICCSDGAAEAVISHKSILNHYYKIPDLEMDISDLAVKSNQDTVAEQSGLNVPRSLDFLTNQSINWDIFPCIIKPYRCAMPAGKSDIHVVYSKAELKEKIGIIQSEKIQIQEYIDKDFEFQLIGCSVNAGEKIIIPGFTKIIRQPKTTNTGYLLYSPIDKIEIDMKSVYKFIKTIGYSGLFSIEFIRGKNEVDYFLEINMRNDGNAYCVQTAGVNLPYIWTYFQYYGKMPEVPTTFIDEVYFIPDLNDLKIAYHEIGLVEWLKEFRHSKSHSIYNKSDKGPFLFEIRRQLKRIIIHK